MPTAEEKQTSSSHRPRAICAKIKRGAVEKKAAKEEARKLKEAVKQREFEEKLESRQRARAERQIVRNEKKALKQAQKKKGKAAVYVVSKRQGHGNDWNEVVVGRFYSEEIAYAAALGQWVSLLTAKSCVDEASCTNLVSFVKHEKLSMKRRFLQLKKMLRDGLQEKHGINLYGSFFEFLEYSVVKSTMASEGNKKKWDNKVRDGNKYEEVLHEFMNKTYATDEGSSEDLAEVSLPT